MNSGVEQISTRAWLVLAEIGFYGFFIRILQLGTILVVLQFDSIFTNPAQIIFLVPIGICTLLILGALTFFEIQCNGVIKSLDNRQKVVSTILDKAAPISEKNFLRRIFLPLVINFASLPLFGFYLIWTTPYLFIILLTSIILSGLVIFRFNTLQRSSKNQATEQKLVQSYNSSENNNLSIEPYLLRQVNRNNSNDLNNDDKSDTLIANESPNYNYKKRQVLGLIRRSSRVLVLITAAILAIYQLSSIAKIAGFLLIANSFREGWLAIFEFMSITNKLLPFSLSMEILNDSLIEQKAIKHVLQSRYETALLAKKRFNQSYSEQLNKSPFMKLKDITVKDMNGYLIVSNLNSRIRLNAITLIIVESNQLATDLVRLLSAHLQKGKHLMSKYHIEGRVFMSTNKTTQYLFDNLPVLDRWKYPLVSTDINDYFDDVGVEKLDLILQRRPSLNQFINSFVSQSGSVEALTPRQSNQLRTLINLFVACAEPTCISVCPFMLDCFDSSDVKLLLKEFIPELELAQSRIVLMTKLKLQNNNICPTYILSQSMLDEKSK